MTIDLSNLASSTLFQWAVGILVLILAFILFRYFFHIVVHVVRLILGFFWHGCLAIVLIAVILFLLHYLRVF